MVEIHKLDYFCCRFLVAGSTKFAPDHLVTLIANAYNRIDIFTDAELQQVCAKFSTAIIEDGLNIRGWRTALSAKCSETCLVFSSSTATTRL